jgi:hypothetical protein
MNIALVSFGRLSPPTIGHRKMIKQMVTMARKINATPMLYLSHSYDGRDSKKPQNEKCKNPLKYEDKLLFCRDAFSEITVVESPAINIYEALHDIYEEGIQKVYIFGGEDRIEDFGERLAKYNNVGNPNDKNFFAFDEPPEIINAGARDENSDNIEERASATLLRRLVVENDYESFKKYAATKSLTKDMFNLLQYEMGITE